jgi:hypothetical protein
MYCLKFLNLNYPSYVRHRILVLIIPRLDHLQPFLEHMAPRRVDYQLKVRCIYTS